MQWVISLNPTPHSVGNSKNFVNPIPHAVGHLIKSYTSWFRVTLIKFIITWCSISMRAGPAFSQFDWSKAGLSIDLPVLVYSHMKTSFKFLSRQGRYRATFYVVTDI